MQFWPTGVHHELQESHFQTELGEPEITRVNDCSLGTLRIFVMVREEKFKKSCAWWLHLCSLKVGTTPAPPCSEAQSWQGQSIQPPLLTIQEKQLGWRGRWRLALEAAVKSALGTRVFHVWCLCCCWHATCGVDLGWVHSKLLYLAWSRPDCCRHFRLS